MSDYTRPMGGETRTVDRPDGTSIHTVSAGSGDRTVVLAHGYGFTLDGWNDVADRLVGNGLRVVLQPDSTLPLVAINLWYHVGSKNEKPGKWDMENGGIDRKY